ncbi:cytokine-dependent hematopoietic cell linker-like [Lutra lutra]|uniref:cytokine-dependent hematopoietic cell linker-like n=1 Tax=Lutra lutra TaxID=9657 RepID=UPI001FD02EEE|nr:cytokine-dependent hematopoietic cell linker-like [Lutra lutra]
MLACLRKKPFFLLLQDGTFLVRDCSTKTRAEPYVLVVFHGNKVYNVKIRFLEKHQQFALGTGLRGDEKFNSVEDIIEHYKYFPIILIDGKDKTGIHREQCYLTQPPPQQVLLTLEPLRGRPCPIQALATPWSKQGTLAAQASLVLEAGSVRAWHMLTLARH